MCDTKCFYCIVVLYLLAVSYSVRAHKEASQPAEDSSSSSSNEDEEDKATLPPATTSAASQSTLWQMQQTTVAKYRTSWQHARVSS